MALMARDIATRHRDVAIARVPSVTLHPTPTSTCSSHGYRGVPVLVFGPVEKKRDDTQGDEAAVEQGAANHYQLARKRPDGGAFPQVFQGRYWSRMHGNLAVVGGALDRENPGIVATQPAPERPNVTDVIHGLAIVGREHRLPVVAGRNALAAQHGRVEMGLDPARPRTPHIEVAIAPRFEAEERENEDADEHQRQGRGILARECNRKGDPECDDRPVGGVVETRPPDRAAVDFTAIEMRERPDLGRAEDLHLGLVLSPVLIHVGPPPGALREGRGL